mmetsp:Transcript_25347/g.74211  ORF Transcript_25347/g.74211 Transcript_25347/m.74211 type:complete len:267 (-) Transcript_25347:260-1060(-)
MTLTSTPWPSSTQRAAPPFCRTSHTRSVESHAPERKTFGSTGDHSMSSTDAPCPAYGCASTTQLPAGVGFQTWMAALQSPVASCPCCASDQSIAKPSSLWPSNVKSGGCCGLGVPPLPGWCSCASCAERSHTCTLPVSAQVAQMLLMRGISLRRLTVPGWLTACCSTIGSSSSSPSESSPSSSSSCRVQHSRDVFMQISLFCDALSACVPATMYDVIGKRIRPSPRLSRTKPKVMHGHSRLSRWSIMYALLSKSSSSPSPIASPAR